MKVRLQPCARWPGRLGLPAALLLLWGALVLGSTLVERSLGSAFETCLFLRATGHPCPTCGSTRALIALFQGQGALAFHWNPLAAMALPVLGLAGLARLGFGRCLSIERDAREARLLWILGLGALAANWAWVLAH